MTRPRRRAPSRGDAANKPQLPRRRVKLRRPGGRATLTICHGVIPANPERSRVESLQENSAAANLKVPRKSEKENPGARGGATGAKSKADGLPETNSTTVSTAKAYRAQEAWKKRNPQKVWAHAALRSGIRRGLVTPLPCEQCGDPKAEAHHDQYDRPLAVRWLCRKHHKQVHAKGRARA